MARELPRVHSSEIEEGCNGVCLCCGEIQYGGVEPDAREYECEACGAMRVYGLEEALMMGEIGLADIHDPSDSRGSI